LGGLRAVRALPGLRPGERLIIGTETFVVQGEPVRDRERLGSTVDSPLSNASARPARARKSRDVVRQHSDFVNAS
jgi:hypothetical protein